MSFYAGADWVWGATPVERARLRTLRVTTISILADQRAGRGFLTASPACRYPGHRTATALRFIRSRRRARLCRADASTLRRNRSFVVTNVVTKLSCPKSGLLEKCAKLLFLFGSPGRIRTSDQPVNSRLLYR